MGKIYGIVRMDIHDGATDQFRARAAEILEAAKPDLTGTIAYEWFLAEHGRTAWVIEIYDDAAAIAHHSKMVGKYMAALKETASVSIEFAGDVPEAMMEQMRARLGDVGYAGPRLQGLLEAPAPASVGPKVGEMIFAVARFAIHPGKLEQFRTLAAEAFDLVQANEPGTLAYEWFVNAEGTECLTLDIYEDAAALGAHMANAGPTMGKILQIVTSDVQIFGALPDAMRAKFRPGVGATFVAPQLQGVM